MFRDTVLLTAALLVAALPLQAQTPKRAPQTTAPQTSMTAAIEKLEHALVTATLRRDSTVLSRLEAPDAMIGNPDGTYANGKADIRTVLSGAVAYDSLTLDSMDVRALGSTAIVSGRAMVRGHAGPNDISGAYRFLDVWTRRQGRWRLVAEQITPVARAH
ncbi:MAG: hypothetical protein NVS9B3_00540 [Gemmatimonadaceae bacterium]